MVRDITGVVFCKRHPAEQNRYTMEHGTWIVLWTECSSYIETSTLPSTVINGWSEWRAHTHNTTQCICHVIRINLRYHEHRASHTPTLHEIHPSCIQLQSTKLKCTRQEIRHSSGQLAVYSCVDYAWRPPLGASPRYQACCCA